MAPESIVSRSQFPLRSGSSNEGAIRSKDRKRERDLHRLETASPDFLAGSIPRQMTDGRSMRRNKWVDQSPGNTSRVSQALKAKTPLLKNFPRAGKQILPEENKIAEPPEESAKDPL